MNILSKCGIIVPGCFGLGKIGIAVLVPQFFFLARYMEERWRSVYPYLLMACIRFCICIRRPLRRTIQGILEVQFLVGSGVKCKR